MKTRPTTTLEKLATSIINIITAIFMAIPIWIAAEPDITTAKFILVYMFFLHNIIPLFFREKRDIGMILMKTYWEDSYKPYQRITYNVLYSASMSTLLFWVYFPFDILLVNLLLLQLPSILLTKTTFHGYISGKMETVKHIG